MKEDIVVELRHQKMNTTVTKLFIIKIPEYGCSLADYDKLYDKAKEYYPHLHANDVSIGITKDTSFMDGHAVICFNVLNEDVNDDFKNMLWPDYFRW